MTLKKTITISILLHICFFSAALLFVEGSGKLPETEVIFISLVAVGPQVVNAAVLQPEKIRSVRKAEKPPVIARKEQKIHKAEVVVEKIEDKVLEEFVLVTKEPVSVEPFADESIGDVKEHGEDTEVAEAVHDKSAFRGQAFAPPGQGAGILPGTIELIYMAIEKVKTYPIIARKRGIEGTVHVSFNIMKNGNPYGIKILKSSGFSILDKATVKVIKKAAPFPLIASRIELPVTYRLRN